MSSRRQVPIGEPFDITTEVVGLERSTGQAWLMDWGQDGPPRIDGYTVGAPHLGGDPPHDGEMHPDADELLILISGRIEVRLELPDGERWVKVGPGQGVVVPRGVWHRIFRKEAGQLVHVTPGPGGEHRPLSG